MHPYIRKTTLLLLLTLCCLLQQAGAQQAYKITPVQWRHLKDDKAFSYKDDKEHVEPQKPYKPGLVEKALLAFFKLFSGIVGQVLLWLIVAAAVICIIYTLAASKGSFLFGKKNKVMAAAGPPAEETDDINQTNWEALLARAAGDNDTRLAVRYSYMWLLQLLQQRELISYRNDKTNYEYYTELNETSYKQPFRQLSRQYEYAWYGHYVPSAEVYSGYAALFDDLRNQLGK